MSELTLAEKKLASKLLELAGDSYANHGCNDFDLTFLSLEERREILKKYEEWNGSPEEYDENHVDVFVDSSLMDYMSHRLKESL